MKRQPLLALILVLASPMAFAMAAIEFLKADTVAKSNVLEPIIISFVSQGYKHVPDWAPLSSACRKLILEKGYNYQDMEEVAKEAALGLGMTR